MRLCQVSWLPTTLAGKARTKAGKAYYYYYYTNQNLFYVCYLVNATSKSWGVRKNYHLLILNFILIGSWFLIIRVINVISIINNSFLIAFTSNWSNEFFGDNYTNRYIFVVVFEVIYIKTNFKNNKIKNYLIFSMLHLFYGSLLYS